MVHSTREKVHSTRKKVQTVSKMVHSTAKMVHHAISKDQATKKAVLQKKEKGT
jgi:cytochrome b561